MSIKKAQKQIYKEIGKIANNLQGKPENKNKTRNELIAQAIDIYYSSSEVAK